MDDSPELSQRLARIAALERSRAVSAALLRELRALVREAEARARRETGAPAASDEAAVDDEGRAAGRSLG